jgi:hypothetical protein
MIPKNPYVFRVYTVAGEPANQVVVLTIGKPRPGLGGWVCRIRIHGIPKGRAITGGEDPLQALQLAIVQARRMLDASGLPLLQYEDGAPGDVGIPLPVSNTHGFEFQRKLERYVERECKRLDDAVAAWLKDGERRRAAKGTAKALPGAASGKSVRKKK